LQQRIDGDEEYAFGGPVRKRRGGKMKFAKLKRPSRSPSRGDGGGGDGADQPLADRPQVDRYSQIDRPSVDRLQGDRYPDRGPLPPPAPQVERPIGPPPPTPIELSPQVARPLSIGPAPDDQLPVPDQDSDGYRRGGSVRSPRLQA